MRLALASDYVKSVLYVVVYSNDDRYSQRFILQMPLHDSTAFCNIMPLCAQLEAYLLLLADYVAYLSSLIVRSVSGALTRFKGQTTLMQTADTVVSTLLKTGLHLIAPRQKLYLPVLSVSSILPRLLFAQLVSGPKQLYSPLLVQCPSRIQCATNGHFQNARRPKS